MAEPEAATDPVTQHGTAPASPPVPDPNTTQTSVGQGVRHTLGDDVRAWANSGAANSAVMTKSEERANRDDHNRREAKFEAINKANPKVYDLADRNWRGIPEEKEYQYLNWNPGGGASPSELAAVSEAASSNRGRVSREVATQQAGGLDQILSSAKAWTFQELRQVVGSLNGVSSEQIQQLREKIDAKHQAGFFDKGFEKVQFYSTDAEAQAALAAYRRDKEKKTDVVSYEQLIKEALDRGERIVVMGDSANADEYGLDSKLGESERVVLTKFVRGLPKGYHEGGVAASSWEALHLPNLFGAALSSKSALLLGLTGLNEAQKQIELARFIALPQNTSGLDLRTLIKGSYSGGYESAKNQKFLAQVSAVFDLEENEAKENSNAPDKKKPIIVPTYSFSTEGQLISYTVAGLLDVLSQEKVDATRFNHYVNRLSSEQLKAVSDQLRVIGKGKGPASDPRRLDSGLDPIFDGLELDRGQVKLNPDGLARKPVYMTFDGQERLKDEQLKMVESFIKSHRQGYKKDASKSFVQKGIRATTHDGWIWDTEGPTYTLLMMAADGLTLEQATEVQEAIKTDPTNKDKKTIAQLYQTQAGDKSARVEVLEAAFNPTVAKVREGTPYLGLRINPEADLWVANELFRRKLLNEDACRTFIRTIDLHYEAADVLGEDVKLELAHTWQESTFRAKVRAGDANKDGKPDSTAYGLKQFIESTGLLYGLSLEDRGDPNKSIPASAQYRFDIERGFGLEGLTKEQAHESTERVRTPDATLGAYWAGHGAIGTTLEISEQERSTLLAMEWDEVESRLDQMKAAGDKKGAAIFGAKYYVVQIREKERKIDEIYKEYYRRKPAGEIKDSDFLRVSIPEDSAQKKEA